MGGRSFAAVLLAAVALGALVVPGTASAHNSLTSSNPKDGAQMARPPAAVTLTFLARLDPETTKVTVAGPGGASMASAAPVFAGKNVTVRLRPGPAGAYTVAYEFVSGDGHPVKGRVRFTAATGNVPAAASPSPAGSPSATPSPSLAPTSGQSTDGIGVTSWIIIGVLVLIAGSLAGVLIRRRTAR